MKTLEDELIERYVDAFNRHDINDVMACFQPVEAWRRARRAMSLG